MKLRLEPPTGGGAVTYKFIEIGLVVLAVVPISILSKGVLCGLAECRPIELGLSMLWLFYGTFNALFLYLPVSLLFYDWTLKRRRTPSRALILALSSGGWAALSWAALIALAASAGNYDLDRHLSSLGGYPAISILTVFLSSLGAGLAVVWAGNRR